MSKRNQHSFRPALTELESREVPNVTSATLAGGIVTVKTSSGGTTDVLVSQTASTIKVKDDITNKSWSFKPAKVAEIVVIAKGGTDNFIASASNAATARLVEFIGGTGTDDFIGTGGPVSMVGGSGADTLWIPSGNDTLVGGTGPDFMIGGTGDDYLQAGSGNDYINGGTGIATIVAGVGNDTIVAMNGQASDTVYTGPGTAVIWSDSVGGVTDNIIGDTTNVTIQAVPGFANTGPTNVLNGGTFAEPALFPFTPQASYEAFTKLPLFAPGGPTAQDVNQYINAQLAAMAGGVAGTGTTLDDSWLLSGLAAIANEDPKAIENNVVDFGDGTYGVKLGGNFYRVDDELPVNIYGETYSAYASLGKSNSIWVPIVEKAFAYYASIYGPPSYSYLAAANGGVTPEVFAAFGGTGFSQFLNPASGLGGFATQSGLGDAMISLLNSGYSVCVGLTTLVTGTDADTGAPVTLPADREYTVMSVSVNISTGQVQNVVLRDPDGSNPDGVTVTLAMLYTTGTGTLDYGLV